MKKEGASAQQQMIRVAEQLNGLHSFQQTFWVSALRAQGMTKLKEFLTQRCAFLTGDVVFVVYHAALTQTSLTASTAVNAISFFSLCRIAGVFCNDIAYMHYLYIQMLSCKHGVLCL